MVYSSAMGLVLAKQVERIGGNDLKHALIVAHGTHGDIASARSLYD